MIDPKSRHLGDGVYVRFDGSHIVLSANHHENDVLYLDDQTAIALKDYIVALYASMLIDEPGVE